MHPLAGQWMPDPLEQPVTIFGVDPGTLLLLFVCASLPFVLLALIVTVLYRRDRRRTPPEPPMPVPNTGGPAQRPPSGEATRPSEAPRPGEDSPQRPPDAVRRRRRR